MFSEDYERKRTRKSRWIKMNTPRIKSISYSLIITSIGPQANIMSAAASSQEKRFVDAVEDEGVAALPNIPGDGRADGGLSIGV
jgi:hypothetical protein